VHKGKSKVGRDITAARDAIAAGGVVAYPTEGVFGLGCNPCDKVSVDKLLTIKKRSVDKGFILIAASFEQIQPFIAALGPDIQNKVDASWPGPVTWILPASTTAPAIVTGGKPTIAVRVTNHATASDLCTQCNCALVSTSANISGEDAFTDAQSVAAQFNDELDYILDYPVGGLKGPTPIFDGATGLQLR